ncbi:hypothetical protein NIES3787_26900 [Microcystis aeruginosa NIES-3787]|uniref:Uncharacterized protein n=2 Tax=Microcystis aeruginosa TaxID=1126 RepID=A0A6H9GGW7_MICAE|nr:hypothetical protein NIES3787_26900 [Microcystis aeruginosa NIES-3787]GCL59554.1 hypothetical protein NIES3807_27300 [Microcystis aeruginosa NIES-3807]
MGIEWQSLLRVINECALQEYGQRADINWLGIDGKSLRNTLENPNNAHQKFTIFVSLSDGNSNYFDSKDCIASFIF